MPTKQRAIALTPLAYQAGSSDKVYILITVLCATGYQTLARYGRRGSKLQTTAKTEAGVTWATAESAFQRMLNEKLGEHYEELTGSDRLNVLAPIKDEYDIISPRDRDDVIKSHPVTAAVTTPEERERAQRLEREERERSEQAELARQALLTHNIRKIRANIDIAIPFVEPDMRHCRLKRVQERFYIEPAGRPDHVMTMLRELGDAIPGSFDADFLLVDDRIIALTNLGRRRPDYVFDGARVFTPARKIAILEAARAAGAGAICFYLASQSDVISIKLDDETRPILAGLIDLLTQKATVAA